MKQRRLSALIEKINRFAPDLGGGFTFTDLWNLIGLSSSDRTAKVIHRLIRDQAIVKIRRGIYTTRDPDLWVLASHLKEKTCISMDSVLARNGLIGTLPLRSVSVTYPGNPQTIETPFGRIRYFKIKSDLRFGTIQKKNGVVWADNEKAYLDLLYYHTKGARFAIDPTQDVSLWKLQRGTLKKYLKCYRNPKFRKFVERLIHGKY